MASFLVVGLGNPGLKYDDTPHNIGFEIIDNLAEQLGGLSYQKKFQGLIAKGSLGGHTVYLLKPQTFMNLSGRSVNEALQFYKISKETHLGIIYDDLDTPLAKLRVRKSGGAGGHNGIGSIIECLGTKDFVRYRVGIGRSDNIPPEAYILAKWKPDKRKEMNEAANLAVGAIRVWIEEGINKAMNQFNKKETSNEP